MQHTTREYREPVTYPPQDDVMVTRDWFAVREDDEFLCRCGWSGTVSALFYEWAGRRFEGSCPSCETPLLQRPAGYTRGELRRALSAGHPDAIAIARSESR